jgi:cytochrome c nitrite reductase small subunit
MSPLFSRFTLVLVACTMVGVAGGLGGYTFYYARGASYLSNDPAACVNCHVMREQYAGWQNASHHIVATCNDCHTPHDLVGKYATKLENGFWHSKGFTLMDFHEPIQIRPQSKAILLENCLYCHQEFVDAILPHQGAAAVDAEIDCIQCHRDVGHGPSK